MLIPFALSCFSCQAHGRLFTNALNFSPCRPQGRGMGPAHSTAWPTFPSLQPHSHPVGPHPGLAVLRLRLWCQEGRAHVQTWARVLSSALRGRHVMGAEAPRGSRGARGLRVPGQHPALSRVTAPRSRGFPVVHKEAGEIGNHSPIWDWSRGAKSGPAHAHARALLVASPLACHSPHSALPSFCP